MQNLKIISVSFMLLLCCYTACTGQDNSNKSDEEQPTYFYTTINTEGKAIFPGEASLLTRVPIELDSAVTRANMDRSLWNKGIPVEWNEYYYPVSDMSYLPYLYLISSNTPLHMSPEDWKWFIYLCTSTMNDKQLFQAGKRIVQRHNEINCTKPFISELTKKGRTFRFELYNDSVLYPAEFTKKPLKYDDHLQTLHTVVETRLSRIDTLRVRAVVYNDRKALEELEKYYHEKGDDLGLAIYYKVMLGYEGNGDLAERFYRVLAPLLFRGYRFRTAVRETLLRAAICDHNERAQELCDSLGFSLCDYRLPTPPQSPQ